jgi:hypothetical protein
MKEYSGKDIEGSWRLRSWEIRSSAGRGVTAPFGDCPEGLLVYTPDGWMSATVCRGDRAPLPAGSSPRKVDERLVAEAYRSYFHYAGPYRVEADTVVHTVRYSLNPNFVGTEQFRKMRIDGPLLTLTGIDRAGNAERHHELVWQRCGDEPHRGSQE